MNEMLLQIPRPLPIVDTVPTWLGPGLLLFGTAAIVAWGIKYAIIEFLPDRTQGTQLLILLLLTIGVVFTTAGGLAQTGSVNIFVLLVIAIGRFIESGAVIRSIRKLYLLITTAAGNSTKEKHAFKSILLKIIERFLNKKYYIASRIGIGFATVGAYILILLINGFRTDITSSITLVWSLSVFSLAVIGLSWKLEAAEDTLSYTLVVGILAASSGSRIFNFVNLSGDVISIIVGSVGSILGLLAGVVGIVVNKKYEL